MQPSNNAPFADKRLSEDLACRRRVLERAQRSAIRPAARPHSKSKLIEVPISILGNPLPIPANLKTLWSDPRPRTLERFACFEVAPSLFLRWPICIGKRFNAKPRSQMVCWRP
jgi:hypothetical protein